MNIPRVTLVALFILCATTFHPLANADFEQGAYGSRNETIVVLNEKDWLPAPHLHFLMLDGRYGTTRSKSLPIKSTENGVLLNDSSSQSTELARCDIIRTPASFFSHGCVLAGQLLELKDDSKSDRPLLVMVHGSEKSPAIGNSRALLFAAQGISVFVYDKRGTGQSEGEYTQNFELLADDAAAAMQHAQDLAAGRFKRSGYFGASQGGWIAPLAATRSQVDFVAIGFGLIASPIEEDRDQMLSEAQELGYDDITKNNILRVSEATARLARSHFVDGFEELETLRQELKKASWFKTINGEHSGDMLRMSDAELRRVGRPLFDNLELQWDYDALSVLKRLDVPILWVLAANDREAPSEQTNRSRSFPTQSARQANRRLSLSRN